MLKIIVKNINENRSQQAQSHQQIEYMQQEIGTIKTEMKHKMESIEKQIHETNNSFKLLISTLQQQQNNQN